MRVLIFLAALFCAHSVYGAEFRLLGHASVFNNDYFGDGNDRWRTGSSSHAHFFGEPWDGSLKEAGIYEFRLRGEVVAPTDASKPPTVGERPFVGMIAIGGAKLFRSHSFDMRLGAELAIIGPQTGVSDFVADAHEFLGFKHPRAADGELPNDLAPTASFEISRTFHRTVERPFELRPFAEAQIGVETYGRIGFDAFFARGVTGDLLSRDVVSGQMMTVITRQDAGSLTPMIGADIAYVWDSAYLPRSSGLTHKRYRMRLRSGLRRVGAAQDLFFGMSWLSPEYEGQAGGQVLGSFSIDHHF